MVGYAIDNGQLSVYINGVLDRTMTTAQVQAERARFVSAGGKGGSGLRVTIPVKKDDHVRLEFSRTDPSLESYARISFNAEGVDPQVDRCMGVKDCLAALGDGSVEAFALRNSNKAQLECVEARDPATISSICAKWTGCLSSQGQLITIRSFLRAAVGSAVASAIQASPSDMSVKPEAGECVDPSIADPESFECECSEQMMRTCTTLNQAFDDCLPRLMCRNAHVCSSWKQTHCSAALTSTSNSSIADMMMTKSQGAATYDKIAGGLDGALKGKCNI